MRWSPAHLCGHLSWKHRHCPSASRHITNSLPATVRTRLETNQHLTLDRGHCFTAHRLPAHHSSSLYRMQSDIPLALLPPAHHTLRHLKGNPTWTCRNFWPPICCGRSIQHTARHFDVHLSADKYRTNNTHCNKVLPPRVQQAEATSKSTAAFASSVWPAAELGTCAHPAALWQTASTGPDHLLLPLGTSS